MIIGVDTGGTFTDLVLYTKGRAFSYKLSSTPGDYARAVLEGVTCIREAAGSTSSSFDLVHSSTVSTNALLEGKGARAGLITTGGFRDVLEIGRQARPALYDLTVEKISPLVPRTRRKEVTERVSSAGKILQRLDLEEVELLLDQFNRAGIKSIAVCLLYSFLRPAHERKIGTLARRRGMTVSLSSDILPEFREYERTSTTVANAYVSPVMQNYLKGISRGANAMGSDNLRIVSSSGGCMSGRAAGRQAVSTLLSGPAAGVIGALSVARQALGKQDVKLITFDMGGTSTDVSLLDGDYQVSKELKIGEHPIGVPMMDIHTVGAGGGSVAFSDAGGGLHVGPESAGADPGPASYGKGILPTVTDANLYLKKLAPDHFLSGRMPLYPERAKEAIGALADELGLSRGRTAAGIVRLVNANMERAIRKISLERGHDPRDFTLVSFGGAGGLHACVLAEALRIPQVLIPVHPGVLSAWGAVSANVVKEFSRTVMRPLGRSHESAVRNAVSKLKADAVQDLQREGFSARQQQLQVSADLRYLGQSYELNVPWETKPVRMAGHFHARHRQRYGHAETGEAVEIVTLRVRAIGLTDKPVLKPIARGKRSSAAALLKSASSSRVYERARLRAGNRISGGALIVEDYATTHLPEGWQATVDDWGNLIAGKP